MTRARHTQSSTTPGRAVWVVLGAVLAALLIPEGGSGIGTLLVFAAAVACWISGRLDDTYVALGAAAVLVALGSLKAHDLFATLGSETIWLLLAAFLLAAGVSRTGLPARLAIALLRWARTPRHLVHLLTLGLVGTAVAIPSTSGRAALTLPVYTALATAFADRKRLVRALAVLFPTVVLLSAIATLIGAGAHLITSQILTHTTGGGIGFARWMACGLPFALVSSHLAAEIVLITFTRRADRAVRLRVEITDLRARAGIPDRVRPAEYRALALLAVVVALWSTEPWHGFSPAVTALAGALAITAPRLGTVRLGTAVSEIPWSLLLFMAATTALGTALSSAPVVRGLAESLLHPAGGRLPLLTTVVLVSVLAHLLIQSRSARSSVLIPLIIPAAVAAGGNPAAFAFASTAAAGFCHTLPSSAKPVAMFARLEGVPSYRPRDLLALSAVLAPVFAVLVLVFGTVVWPHLGLPLH